MSLIYWITTSSWQIIVLIDAEEAGERLPPNNGSSASNENPASGSLAPQPVVPSAVGLVSGAGSAASSHQPPYDLRRKSPHHDPAAAAVAPNYPSGCPAPSSTSSSPACPAGPSGYAANMLPARKRPRRTCYATCESKLISVKYAHSIWVTIGVVKYLQTAAQWRSAIEVQHTTSSMNYPMKSS